MLFKEGESEKMKDKPFILAEKPSRNPASFEELESVGHYTLTPIDHDYAGRTPLIWNSLYEKFGLDFRSAMIVFDSKQAEELIKFLRLDPKYVGGGVGVGFKDELVRLVDELDPLATVAQSINVIKKLPDGKLFGYNTDGLGFRDSLLATLGSERKPEEMKVVILGAGGTGNSITFALAEVFGKVVVLNRSVEKAVALSERVNSFIGSSVCLAGGENRINEEIASADVVVNVSVKGATGDLEQYSSLAPAKLPPTPEHIQTNLAQAEQAVKLIPAEAIVCDIVLRPDDSPLLATAKSRGLKTLNGLSMVYNQAAEAFWIVHQEALTKLGVTKEEVEEAIKAIP